METLVGKEHFGVQVFSFQFSVFSVRASHLTLRIAPLNGMRLRCQPSRFVRCDAVIRSGVAPNAQDPAAKQDKTTLLAIPFRVVRRHDLQRMTKDT